MALLQFAVLVLLLFGLIQLFRTSDRVADPSPWAVARITEEERMLEPPLWLSGGGAALLGSVAWRLTVGADWASPAGRAAVGLAFGLALLGIGLAFRWRARLWQAAGFSCLLVTLTSAALLDRSVFPLLGLAFLVVTAVTALTVLGLRPGILAVTMGAVGGAAASVSLNARSLTPAGVVLLLFLAVLFILVWRWGRMLPVLLAFLGFALVRTPSAGVAPSWEEWTAQLVLVFGAFVLARLEPYLQGIAWLAAGWGAALVLDPAAPLAVRWSLGALLTLGALAAHWGATRPARWTALSAAAGVALFLPLMLRDGGGEIGWSGIAFAASVLYLGGAWLAARGTRDEGEEAARMAVAPLAAATAAFTVLAVALEIGRGWPAIAAALLAPLLLLLAAKLRVPLLSSLALAAALFYPGWVIFHVRDFGGPGDLPWGIYGFGIAFLALVAAAWAGHRSGLEAAARRMEWLTVLSGVLLNTLLVRELVPGATTTALATVFLAPLLAYSAWRFYRWRLLS